MAASFSSAEWRFPPAGLEATPGVAHVFRLSLDLPDPMPLAYLNCLSAEEQQRSARMATPLLRQRYASAHAQVRHILASFLGCSPASIRYTRGPHGKPSLTPESQLRFNLTHSEGMGLLAVCLAQETGVDIEFPRENIDLAVIARRFFAPVEAEAILMLPTEEQRQAFLACWTRKEAYIKALGSGLSIPLGSFAVSVHPGEPITLTLTDSGARVDGWSLYEIDPGAGCAAALAVSGGLTGISCWDWPLPG